MSIRHLRTALFASVLLGSTAGILTLTAEPGTVDPVIAGSPAETDIFEEMMGIRSSLRTLSQQLNDASKDEESVKLIWAMQGHLINARQADPPTMETLPEDQHAGHRTAYRKALAETLREMINLELDLLAGKREEAMNRLRDGLMPLRNAAHEQFQSDQ